MIRFLPPSWPGDRRLAMCGSVEVGAVFPPCGAMTKWRWTLWIAEAAGTCHRARSEAEAKAALQAAWAQWMAKAGLVAA